MNQNLLFEIKKFPCAPVFFTDKKKCSNLEAVVKNLPRNSVIIIREYDLSAKDREDFARKILQIARPKGLKIVVGKDLALAKKIKADGLHFSDLDKLPKQFLQKKSFPKNFIFSFSTHSQKSFQRARNLGCDQVFLSPIFSTTSHVEAKAFGLKNLAKISSQSKNSKYLRALGGVNLENLKRLRKLGICGFAAIDLFCKNL